MRVVAIDHGSVRTGVAVSDPTGTVSRPVTVVERVDADSGFRVLLDVIRTLEPQRVVVGLPVSLGGGEHDQARRARAFAGRLAQEMDVPVDLYDERFTSKVADQRGGAAARDARAAATLLDDYLRTLGDRQA